MVLKNDFWKSLQINLFFQRVHGVSPFTIKNGKLVSSWRITLAIFLGFIIYIILMSFSLYSLIRHNFFHNIFFSNGYLFAIIGCFEIGFSNFSYILLVIFGSLTKHKQIAFINALYKIDAILGEKFNEIFIDYHWQRQLSAIKIVFTVIYYNSLTFMLLMKFYQYQMLTIPLTIFTLCYEHNQMSSSMQNSCYINLVQQIRIRFLAIKKLAKQLLLIGKQSDIENEKIMIQKILTLIQTYKKLTDMMNVLNQNANVTLMLRYIHDFTLTTSQIYLIFWIIIDEHDADDEMAIIFYIIFWMAQNVYKLFLLSWETENTKNEVNLYYDKRKYCIQRGN